MQGNISSLIRITNHNIKNTSCKILHSCFTTPHSSTFPFEQSIRGADKSLSRPTSRCILFDGQNISLDASLVIHIHIHIYINSTNISPIIIINRKYETQNLLSLQLASFLVGLRTYQHPCILFDGENISFDASLVLYIYKQY